MSDPARPCLDLLREADPDRYLACLWLREEWRGAIAALYAFDAEIARIPALVSEPMPGEIRLQWWREILLGTRESGDHPVGTALLDAITRHDLPVAAFDTYLDARIFDLYHDPMPDRASFEGYAGETESMLLTMAAQCAGLSRGTDLADACGHGGVARTIAATLRATALHRHQKRCHIPADMLANAGMEVGAWLDDDPGARHLAVVHAMVDWGLDHLAKSRTAIATIDREHRAVFLPLATVEAWLRAARRAGADLFVQPLTISPLRRQWATARAALTGL